MSILILAFLLLTAGTTALVLTDSLVRGRRAYRRYSAVRPAVGARVRVTRIDRMDDVELPAGQTFARSVSRINRSGFRQQVPVRRCAAA